MASQLPPTSTLAAKPPQRPSPPPNPQAPETSMSTTLPHHTSSTSPTQSSNQFNIPDNIAAKIQAASAGDEDLQKEGEGKVGEGEVGPTSPDGWKPKFNRQQSFSQQDMKRLMQEDMMSPTKERVEGFTSEG